MKSEYSEHFNIGKNVSFDNEQSTIINEDVLTTCAIEKESIDLIVTSRPYNVDIKYNSNGDALSYTDYLIYCIFVKLMLALQNNLRCGVCYAILFLWTMFVGPGFVPQSRFSTRKKLK